MAITIVGLGPGDAGLITRQAWHLLSAADAVYLRTARHPAVAELPHHLLRYTFDEIYQSSEQFDEVCRRIADEILHLGSHSDVIYAVPGDPSIGEATVAAIAHDAANAGIDVQIIPGLSFVEPTLAALGVDGLDGLQIFDAIEVAGLLYPPVNPDVPVLLGQVHNNLLAGDLKPILLNIYPPEHNVALVHSAGQSDQVVEWMLLREIDRSARIDHLSSLFIPAMSVKAGLANLAQTVATLRSPGGCPWDQEQTPQSMRGGFLEEAYEVLAALDAEDTDNLREELGDLLYHIVMQTQMASEAGDFTLADVIAGIEAKLKRRHPHVWGDWQVSDTAEVLRNWEWLKEQEKAGQPAAVESRLSGVPLVLPALTRSQKIQSKAARAGFDWPDISGVYAKLEEEINELQSAATSDEKRLELGDILFVVANLAQWLNIDAESALREANNRFSARFQQIERFIAARGLSWEALSFSQLDALWVEAKATLADSILTDKVEDESA